MVRATTDGTEFWDDPTDAVIFALMAYVGDGRDEFIIIERTVDATGDTYIQAAPNLDGSWLVEHRAGSADRHFATRVADLGRAHELLAAWAFDRPGWESSVTWSPVIL